MADTEVQPAEQPEGVAELATIIVATGECEIIPGGES